MAKVKWFAMMGVVLALGMSAGCGTDENSGGDATDSYSGTWTGNVCGRGLTLELNQNGTSLSGVYTLSNPTFVEIFNGSASSPTPPATATLKGGGDRTFELTFSSYNTLSGGFYKSGVKVCDVSAAK